MAGCCGIGAEQANPQEPAGRCDVGAEKATRQEQAGSDGIRAGITW